MNTDARSNDARGKSMSSRFCKTKLTTFFAVPLLAATLVACQGGTIQGITGQPAKAGLASKIVLNGSGVCDKVQIDFGDGTPPAEIAKYDFANPPAVTHVYKFGGKKTVKAGSLENCVGTAEMVLAVPSFVVGYQAPRPTSCDPVPMLPLPQNAKLHITSNPATKINFGCLLDRCIYNANGQPGSATPGYAFPGLKPLSLVVRVGGMPFQGGTDVSFVSALGGSLEVCQNDDNLSDNSGGWGIMIDVDEP